MKFLTTTLARILFALPFGVFGVLHFINAGMMQGIVPSFMPFKAFWVYLTGVALILACISILTKVQIKLASLLLALMLLIFVLTIHLPAAIKGMSLVNLLKDISLAAAALLVAGGCGKD